MLDVACGAAQENGEYEGFSMRYDSLRKQQTPAARGLSRELETLPG